MPATVRGYGGVHDTDTSIDPNSQPGIPSNITGTTPGGYDPAYGGVPLIPDPTASAWQAIGGDLNTLPQAFTLGNAYNLFNFGQQQQTLQGTPSYNSVLDLMGGKLPQDVINQIAQQSAERGVEGGHPNDPNANAAYLHALGLNSLQAQATGQQQYGALAGHYPMAAPFNLMDFLTTPEQQQAANTAANTNAAAPNPAAAARAEQAALLAAIAAGKGSVPPVGAAPGIPNLSGGISGGLSGPPPAQTMVGASTATGIPNPNGSTSRVPTAPYAGIQQALNQFGPSASADPWTGAVNRGTNPANTNWWQNQDPYGALSGMDWGAPSPGGGSIPDQNAPAYSGGGASGTNPASTNWWSSPDPWASLLGMDWGAPSDFGGGNGSQLVGSGPDWGYTPGTPSSQSNWWESSDPWSALTGTDFTAPDMGGGEQIPDWAALPGEDYYGG